MPGRYPCSRKLPQWFPVIFNVTYISSSEKKYYESFETITYSAHSTAKSFFLAFFLKYTGRHSVPVRGYWPYARHCYGLFVKVCSIFPSLHKPVFFSFFFIVSYCVCACMYVTCTVSWNTGHCSRLSKFKFWLWNILILLFLAITIYLVSSSFSFLMRLALGLLSLWILLPNDTVKHWHYLICDVIFLEMTSKSLTHYFVGLLNNNERFWPTVGLDSTL